MCVNWSEINWSEIREEKMKEVVNYIVEDANERHLIELSDDYLIQAFHHVDFYDALKSDRAELKERIKEDKRIELIEGCIIPAGKDFNTQFRKRIELTIVEVLNEPTDWSVYADWFLEWLYRNDFKLKSFEGLVQHLRHYYSLEGETWDFFFGYTSLDEFVEDWVAEEEREDFRKFCSTRA